MVPAIAPRGVAAARDDARRRRDPGVGLVGRRRDMTAHRYSGLPVRLTAPAPVATDDPLGRAAPASRLMQIGDPRFGVLDPDAAYKGPSDGRSRSRSHVRRRPAGDTLRSSDGWHRPNSKTTETLRRFTTGGRPACLRPCAIAMRRAVRRGARAARRRRRCAGSVRRRSARIAARRCSSTRTRGGVRR